MRKRNLLIIVAVIVLLIAGYVFAVNYTPSQNADPTPTPKADNIVVFETDSEQISKISFENQTPFSLVKNEGVWKIEGNSAEIIQASAMTLSYAAAYVSAEKEVEKAENLADFGLDNPTSIVTVYHGETITKLLLGSKTPTNNSYYFKLDSDNRVFVISEYNADLFFKTPSSVRDLEILSLSPGEITSIEILSPTQNLKVLKNTEAEKAEEQSYASLSKWKVLSPFEQIAAEDKVTEKLLTPLASIKAESVAEDGSANLSAYNLNTTVTVQTADKSYSFKLGQANGVNYLYSPAKNIVYVVLKTSVAFADVSAFDIIQRLIVFPNINDLKSVEVKTQTVTSVLERAEKSEKEATYTINKKSVDEKAFKSAYQSIMALTVDGIIDNNFKKQNLLTTILYTLENGTTEKVEFYDYNDFSAAVVLNGKAQFYIKKTKLDELESILKAL